ncbi:class I SAM-dependent methyltransferase [Natrarchaeobius sp. A-rgal3]|uniref:class I SAM-dependent methyltransferase n=1 Tax=Natrarchaeobius versutus TaxID=1679078 RepID=UPI00350FC2C4
MTGKETTGIYDLSEYDKIREDSLAKLFDVESNQTQKIIKSVRDGPIEEHIQNCRSQMEEKPYSLGGANLGGETAHVLTHLIKPNAILEIGVANGVSTAYILGALEELELEPDIRAIDKPLFESDVREKRGERGIEGVGGIIPNGAEAGWVVPMEWRADYGYQYYVADFTEILPRVIRSMPKLDLVIYDASKDASEMIMAYETIIQSLSSNGVLISDDICVNNSFEKVTDGYEGETVKFGGIGIYKNTV